MPLKIEIDAPAKGLSSERVKRQGAGGAPVPFFVSSLPQNNENDTSVDTAGGFVIGHVDGCFGGCRLGLQCQWTDIGRRCLPPASDRRSRRGLG
uniref:Uncharacterized protein n=1 Tax=Globodera pallida TaxID=36090 RepID=A0A183CIE3_GLOPA